MPNQDQNSNANPGPIFPQADLPPLPPSFQDIPQGGSTGSAAPSDTPPNSPPVISGTPKKKFGGGRIIATILGILLLVGGVGAGFVLTQQRQLFQQKAKVCECDSSNPCGSGFSCSNATCGSCVAAPATKCPQEGQCASGAYRWATDTNLPSPYCYQKYDASCLSGGGGGGGTTAPLPNCQVGLTCVNYNPDVGSCPSDYPNKCIQPNQSITACCKPAGGTGGGGGGGTTPQCKDASQIKCDANGCTVGSNYLSTTPSCFVMKYHCNDIKGSGVSCDQLTGATLEGTGATESFSANCGTEQIDINCGACNIVYPAAGQQYFTSKRYASACTTAATPGGPSAQCLSVKAYNTGWTLLASSDLSSLKAGSTVNFCVGGTTTGGAFDKAKFTINGVAQAETTTKRPASEDFCQSYEIPAGVSSFSVSSQIHHATLGWSL